jgi:hypothetical protein
LSVRTFFLLDPQIKRIIHGAVKRPLIYFALKNLVLTRNAGSSMGQACPALLESEIDGFILEF